MDIRPGGLLAEGLKVADTSRRTGDQTYAIIAGKSASGRDHFNEVTIALQEKRSPGRRIELIFRAYDDGVAFRYAIPKQDALEELDVIAERSEFRFAGNHRCWPILHEHFQTSFESEFHKKNLSDLKPGGLVGLPLLVEIDDGPSVAITEANLTNYAGMYLEGVAGAEAALVSRLAPRQDGSYSCVRGKTPLSSPWRVVMMAESAGELIESNLLYHLNEPCAIGDTSWIKPGRVVWDWWSSWPAPGFAPEHRHNNETMRHFIDFAAEMKAEYFLLDGGWYRPVNHPDADITRPIREIDLPGLVRYANDRGVEFMVWMHQNDTRRNMDEAFAWYHSLNIKGIKVDFFDRDDQEMVNHARRVVETAAKHRLLVDLHGIYKPTGVERTYPNLMTHEGIMGAEYNKWSKRITPGHNVTIPFTRMLAGPMDYTPGAFRNVTAEQFVARNVGPMAMGTRCHNLAMYVVYQSGLQMVSDDPDSILNQPGSEFLKLVPAAWDETRFLAGKVGELVAVARRNGESWFIGAMTNSTPRELELSLEFLGAGNYAARIWADGPNAATAPTSVAFSERAITSGESLSVPLAPAGGFVATFQPRK